MAIVKLVCQGCGANLDAKDDQRVVQCGYCGTSNQLKRTVHQEPPPKPQPTQVYQPQAQPQPQRSGGAVKWIVLIAVLAPVLLGGFITFMVFKTTAEVFDRVGVEFDKVKGIGLRGGGVQGRRYRWDSPRPFLADVDGDGSEDLIGAIQELGSQNLLLTAMSGADWSTLWEVDLGPRSDLPDPKFYFEPESKTVLLKLGATLHGHDAKTGQQRFVASLPDKIDALAMDDAKVWLHTIDGEGHVLDLASGQTSPADAKPSAQARALPSAEGYELIPELRELDLKTKQFDDLRVEKGFCPKPDLSFSLNAHRHRPKCHNPNGLAYAVRAKGTDVPFLVGYERESKAERWRVQITKAGTLQTVDGGFGQPRAEIFGDDAIISYVPDGSDNARIRRISLTDGATKWDVELTRQTTDNVDAMVVGSQRLYVTYGMRIVVLKLDSGEQVAELGGM